MGFEHLDAQQLGAFRARAAQLAELLGGPGVAAAVVGPIATWLWSDPAHPLFGCVVDPVYLQNIDQHVIRGSAALILYQTEGAPGRWTPAERVRELDKPRGWRRNAAELVGMAACCLLPLL